MSVVDIAVVVADAEDDGVAVVVVADIVVVVDGADVVGELDRELEVGNQNIRLNLVIKF